MPIFLLFLTCPLFLILYKDNKISLRNFIIPLYYLNFFVAFSLNGINNFLIWSIFTLFVFILLFYQTYCFIKNKSDISLNYILIYFVIFYEIYYFVESCKINVSESFGLALIYGNVMNLFFYFLIVLLYILYIFLKLFKIKINLNIIDNILILPLIFLVLFIVFNLF